MIDTNNSFGTNFRICAIDPGTDTLGLAVMDIDLEKGSVLLHAAMTFKGEKLAKAFPDIQEVHGDKIARLRAHEANLYEQFKAFSPQSIICEAPFLSRFPAAYAALVECQTAIRNAVIRYDQSIPLEVVDPMQAKLAVGASKPKGKKGRKGRSKHSKDEVRKAILAMRNLLCSDGVVLEDLDEHSMDAVAVGYFKFIKLKEAGYVGSAG